MLCTFKTDIIIVNHLLNYRLNIILWKSYLRMRSKVGKLESNKNSAFSEIRDRKLTNAFLERNRAEKREDHSNVGSKFHSIPFLIPIHAVS